MLKFHEYTLFRNGSVYRTKYICNQLTYLRGIFSEILPNICKLAVELLDRQPLLFNMPDCVFTNTIRAFLKLFFCSIKFIGQLHCQWVEFYINDSQINSWFKQGFEIQPVRVKSIHLLIHIFSLFIIQEFQNRRKG